MIIDFIKVFLPALAAFSIGLIITPLLTAQLYKYRAWKKKPGKTTYDGREAIEFNKLHKEKEVNTPRMGGVVIWLSALITIVGFWLLARFTAYPAMAKLDFLSRDQTWIPLAALLIGGIVGFLDDLLEVTKSNGGISLRYRLLLVGILGLVCGWWFYFKLEVTAIGLPNLLTLNEGWEIGWLIVPVFALLAMIIYSGGIIDGLDGLAGGIFASIYTAYSVIAFNLGQMNLAAFCAMIAGAILAFLWFNIPPARFYMSETGSMALTLALAVVVFTADSLGGGFGILILPIVALPLFITSGSVILQLLYRKVRGRKLFIIAPLHHHFEAIGWPSYKVVMRYWVISAVTALFGVILAVAGSL